MVEHLDGRRLGADLQGPARARRRRRGTSTSWRRCSTRPPDAEAPAARRTGCRGPSRAPPSSPRRRSTRRSARRRRARAGAPHGRRRARPRARRALVADAGVAAQRPRRPAPAASPSLDTAPRRLPRGHATRSAARSTTSCSRSWPARSGTGCTSAASAPRGSTSTPACPCRRATTRSSRSSARCPSTSGDPIERLRAIAARMRDLKQSSSPRTPTRSPPATDFAPPTILARAARLGFDERACSLLVTNVPGPQSELFVLGRRLERTFPVPVARRRPRARRRRDVLRRRDELRPARPTTTRSPTSTSSPRASPRRSPSCSGSRARPARAPPEAQVTRTRARARAKRSPANALERLGVGASRERVDPWALHCGAVSGRQPRRSEPRPPCSFSSSRRRPDRRARRPRRPSFTFSPAEPEPGQTVQFDGTSSTDDGARYAAGTGTSRTTGRSTAAGSATTRRSTTSTTRRARTPRGCVVDRRRRQHATRRRARSSSRRSRPTRRPRLPRRPRRRHRRRRRHRPTVQLFAPDKATLWTPVGLTATATGSALTYAWDLDGNGSFEHPDRPLPFVVHKFTAAADVAAGVRVTDDAGQTAQSTKTDPRRRPAGRRASASPPRTSQVGKAATIKAGSPADDQARISHYLWKFEDDGKTTGGHKLGDYAYPKDTFVTKKPRGQAHVLGGRAQRLQRRGARDRRRRDRDQGLRQGRRQGQEGHHRRHRGRWASRPSASPRRSATRRRAPRSSRRTPSASPSVRPTRARPSAPTCTSRQAQRGQELEGRQQPEPAVPARSRSSTPTKAGKRRSPSRVGVQPARRRPRTVQTATVEFDIADEHCGPVDVRGVTVRPRFDACFKTWDKAPGDPVYEIGATLTVGGPELGAQAPIRVRPKTDSIAVPPGGPTRSPPGSSTSCSASPSSTRSRWPRASPASSSPRTGRSTRSSRRRSKKGTTIQGLKTLLGAREARRHDRERRVRRQAAGAVQGHGAARRHDRRGDRTRGAGQRLLDPDPRPRLRPADGARRVADQGRQRLARRRDARRLLDGPSRSTPPTTRGGSPPTGFGLEPTAASSTRARATPSTPGIPIGSSGAFLTQIAFFVQATRSPSPPTR